jgi:hypothetical protein
MTEIVLWGGEVTSDSSFAGAWVVRTREEMVKLFILRFF